MGYIGIRVESIGNNYFFATSSSPAFYLQMKMYGYSVRAKKEQRFKCTELLHVNLRTIIIVF
jgi:hypothetical protein